MRKGNCFKSLMRTFALVASIGGVLYLFKDKIMESSVFSMLKERLQDFTQSAEFEEDASDDDDDDGFAHAFDVDPSTEREYVSLNITSPEKNETSTDKDDDADAALE